MRRTKKPFNKFDYPAYTPPVVELPQDPADAVPDLRRHAADMWENINDVFATSQQLVQWVWRPVEWMRLLKDWVVHLELLVRRMILIQALSVKLDPVKPRRPTSKAYEPRIRGGHWAAPETWKVSFRVLPLGPRERLGPNSPPAFKPFSRTAPVARRIEALRRAISLHDIYAQRAARSLARIMARNATANEPRVYVVDHWDFHPWRDSTAAHNADRGLRVATPLLRRLFDKMQGLEITDLEPRPG